MLKKNNLVSSSGKLLLPDLPDLQPSDIAALNITLKCRDLLLNEVSLGEPEHGDDGKLHEKIDEGEEDHEVVQAALPILHLI